MRRTLQAVLIGALCALFAAPVLPQPRDHRERGAERHDFGGRDYRHFNPSERHAWEGGHWMQGWHDNRFGWWWGTDLGWFLYPQPVYPYPAYVPPVAAGPPQPWYYCDDPPGYYPYVPNCRLPWRQVPATPDW